MPCAFEPFRHMILEDGRTDILLFSSPNRSSEFNFKFLCHTLLAYRLAIHKSNRSIQKLIVRVSIILTLLGSSLGSFQRQVSSCLGGIIPT